MIYFVNPYTKDRIEYDDIENRIFAKKELPIDLSDIATKLSARNGRHFTQ